MMELGWEWVGGKGRDWRSGTTVVEMVVALGLLMVFASLAGTLLVRSLGAFRTTMDRADALTTLAVTRHVLGGELRATVGNWTFPDARSVEVRGFRGTGVPCPGSGVTDVLDLAVRGDRSVDPVKDSAWVLQSEGQWVGVAIDGRSATARDLCIPALGPGWSQERWQLRAAVDRPVLVRFFEVGTYVLDGKALRYRRGAGGRQPLTPPTIDDDGSSWSPGRTGSGLALRIAPTLHAPAKEYHLHFRPRARP